LTRCFWAVFEVIFFGHYQKRVFRSFRSAEDFVVLLLALGYVLAQNLLSVNDSPLKSGMLQGPWCFVSNSV
jgi:hypothetical protein